MALALLAFIAISLAYETRELSVFANYAKSDANEPIPDSNAGADNDIHNDTQQHISRTRRFDESIQSLESLDLRFYMYSDPNITRDDVHRRALKTRSNPRLKERFINDARAEIDIIRMLAAHPLRTSDPKNASIFVIPISSAAHMILRENMSWLSAVRSLTETPLFRRTGGNRHLMVSLSQQAFDYGSIKYTRTYGMDEQMYAQLWNVTIVRESDPFESVAMAERGEGGDFAQLFREKAPVTSHAFSIGLMMGMNNMTHGKRGGGQNALQCQPATYDKFERSSNFLFYQTRIVGWGFNSTIYRHVLVNATMNDRNNGNSSSSTSSVPSNDHDDTAVISSGRLPHSTIGIGDLQANKWAVSFSDAKFCLAVRGDTPHTHALLRAVQVGCIPVVVSEYYERYSPTFRSLIRMDDYVVMIDERRFVEDPIGTLVSDLVGLSEEFIRMKLEGLRYAQRIMSMDHPDSLFVPALLHATNQEMETVRDTKLSDAWKRVRRASKRAQRSTE